MKSCATCLHREGTTCEFFSNVATPWWASQIEDSPVILGTSGKGCLAHKDSGSAPPAFEEIDYLSADAFDPELSRPWRPDEEWHYGTRGQR